MTKIVFMGTPDFAVPVLEQLVKDGYDVVGVVTQPDKPKGRKQQLTPPPVKVKAEQYGIPVLQPTKIREKEQYEQVMALQPDLIVTAAFGQILPKALLDAPKHGCINVHASLLPELRGGAPIHYAILQGKEKTGITIMYMVEQLDAGDILTQVEAGAKLLSETIPLLLSGNIAPIKQDETKATFAYNIKREQEKIDWSKSGEEVYNHIRGMNPWPVAYTTYQGQTWKIWWGEKVAMPHSARPGTIMALEQDGIIVATGNETAIKITELQPAGKRKMTATEFLRGTTLEIGTTLGDEHE
jgi:methionyl-tRNA formyltransferase